MTAKKAGGKGSAHDADDAPSQPYETLLEVIDLKLKELEGGDLTLEKSLQAYEEGVRALKQCYAMLKQAEGKIRVLTSTGSGPDAADEPELADYDTDSDDAAQPGKRKAPKTSTSDKDLF